MISKEHETWDWDVTEDKGYNLMSALEVTFINFKLMDGHSEIVDSQIFSKRYSVGTSRMLMKRIDMMMDIIEEMQITIDRQEVEITNFKAEMKAESDALWSDIKDHDHHDEFRALECSIEDIGVDLDNHRSDMDSEINSIKCDIDSHSSDISSLANEVADLTLLR